MPLSRPQFFVPRAAKCHISHKLFAYLRLYLVCPSTSGIGEKDQSEDAEKEPIAYATIHRVARAHSRPSLSLTGERGHRGSRTRSKRIGRGPNSEKREEKDGEGNTRCLFSSLSRHGSRKPLCLPLLFLPLSCLDPPLCGLPAQLCQQLESPSL